MFGFNGNTKSSTPKKMLDIERKGSFLARHRLLFWIVRMAGRIPLLAAWMGRIEIQDDEKGREDNLDVDLAEDIKSMIPDLTEACRERYHLPLLVRDKDGILTLHLGDENSCIMFAGEECRSIREFYFLLSGMMWALENPKREWETKRQDAEKAAHRYHIANHVRSDPEDIHAHPMAAQMYGIYCDKYLMCGNDPNHVTGFKDFITRKAWKVLEVEIHTDRYLMLEVDFPGMHACVAQQLAHTVVQSELTAQEAESLLQKTSEEKGIPIAAPLFHYFGFTDYKHTYYQQYPAAM